MSVQVGIRSFDGREIPKKEIEFLLYGLEERGPDYSGTCASGHLAMGFRGFLIAPEDKQDQPLCGSSGVLVTFDGRLDRREDLARQVGLAETTTVSDAILILKAYDLYQKRSFELLMGEYAFVLWDEQRQSLFMVRSLCGTRPLLYVPTETQVVWSSELDDLILKSNFAPRVNHVYVARYLYFHPDVDDVPFNSIHTVPPGTYVEVGPSGDIKSPVATWHPESISTLQLPSDADYEQAWRKQVEDAVADRLRVVGPVFSELSGGLDSTALVFMADRVLAKRGQDPSSLITVSYTFETSEDSDESFFISIAEKARGYIGVHISEELQHITLGLDDITFTGFPATRHIFKSGHKIIGQAMRDCGARVLLSGFGGDEVFWSDATSTPELADLLCERRFAEVVSRSREWSQVSGVPFWRYLLTNAILPIARSGRLSLWSPDTDIPLDSLLADETRQLLRDPGRKLGLQVDAGIVLPSRRARAFSIRSAIATLSSGTFRNLDYICYSHPYSHQGLINFMLALSMSQVVRPGEGRSLMRRATRGILPERIRVRRSKSGPDEAFCRALSRERDVLADPSRLLVCQHGYVDHDKLQEAIREATLGRTERVGCLLNVLSVERWLRSLALIERRRLEFKRSFADTSPTFV